MFVYAPKYLALIFGLTLLAIPTLCLPAVAFAQDDPETSTSQDAGTGASRTPIRLAHFGWGLLPSRFSDRLTYAAVIENPNAHLAAEHLPFRITAYDGAGNVIRTTSPSVRLSPGGQVALAGTIALGEGDRDRVARLDIEGGNGAWVPQAAGPGFGTENVSYRPGVNPELVTAVITNPSDQPARFLRVAAVGYNQAGRVIGGGETLLDFVAAQSRAPVEIRLALAGTAARVELYPALSSLSD